MRDDYIHPLSINGQLMKKDARIAELEDENRTLREALKPFAGMAQYCDNMSDSESHCVFVGDLRAARAALKGEKNG